MGVLPLCGVLWTLPGFIDTQINRPPYRIGQRGNVPDLHRESDLRGPELPRVILGPKPNAQEMEAFVFIPAHFSIFLF